MAKKEIINRHTGESIFVDLAPEEEAARAPSAEEVERERTRTIQAGFRKRADSLLVADDYQPGDEGFVSLAIQLGTPAEQGKANALGGKLRALQAIRDAAMSNGTPADLVVWPA